jgi:uroporphyrinogen III methyltransferase/synthase
MKKGIVYIIGVGPGDYKLLTLKAVECIKKADVLVYDRLINKKVFSFAHENVELINVGKMPDNHAVPQERINEILVEQAKMGKVVARIKGGDPFVFGRGGEECLYLREHGIVYEVVPGVTSAISVPAYAGIPVTHRDFCSSLHIITGHENPNKEDSSVDFEVLSKINGTLVFLMGVKNLEGICTNLVKNGKSENTPVAVIERGTSSKQRVVIGNLNNIFQKILNKNIKSPAITVVGEVVTLKEKLEWFNKKPLFGKRIVVTRAREQASKLVEKIEELGGEAIEFPVIKIENPESYNEFDRALDNIRDYKWLVFTSVNGVWAFFDRMKIKNIDIRNLCDLNICAVGEATEKELNARGLLVDYVPEKYTTEELLCGIKPLIKKDEKVLLARADIASVELSEGLLRAGISFDDVTVYRTSIQNTDKEEVVGLFEQEGIDYITFASSSTVTNFVSIVGKEILEDINRKGRTKFVSIGPVTSKTLESYGVVNYICPKKYTIDAMLEIIVEDLIRVKIKEED